MKIGCKWCKCPTERKPRTLECIECPKRQRREQRAHDRKVDRLKQTKWAQYRSPSLRKG